MRLWGPRGGRSLQTEKFARLPCQIPDSSGYFGIRETDKSLFISFRLIFSSLARKLSNRKTQETNNSSQYSYSKLVV